MRRDEIECKSYHHPDWVLGLALEENQKWAKFSEFGRHLGAKEIIDRAVNRSRAQQSERSRRDAHSDKVYDWLQDWLYRNSLKAEDYAKYFREYLNSTWNLPSEEILYDDLYYITFCEWKGLLAEDEVYIAKKPTNPFKFKKASEVFNS